MSSVERVQRACGRFSVIRPMPPSDADQHVGRPGGRSWQPVAAGSAIRRGCSSVRAMIAPHDLVGAFQDLVHAQVAHDLLHAVIGQVAVAAMQLQRRFATVEAGVGGERAWPWRTAGWPAALARIQRGRRPATGRCATASSSVAMSARRNCSAWNCPAVRPNAPAFAPCRRTALSSAACAPPSEQAAMFSRPPSSPPWRCGTPAPSSPEPVRRRHAAVLQDHRTRGLGVPAHLLLVGAIRQARACRLPPGRR